MAKTIYDIHNGIARLFCGLLIFLSLGQARAQVSEKKIKLWDGLVLGVTVDGKGAAKADARDVWRIKKSLMAKITSGHFPKMGDKIRINTLEDAIGNGMRLDTKDGSVYTFFIGLAKRNTRQFDFDESTRHDTFLKALRTHIAHVNADMGVSDPPRNNDPLLSYIVAASDEYELAIMKWRDASIKAEKFAQNKRAFHESGVMFEHQLIWEDPLQNRRALIILTSDKHGYWGEELVAPVEALRAAGIAPEFASPAGKAVIDPTSAPDPDIPNQWTSPEMARKVRKMHSELSSGTLKPSDVRGDDYDAVLVVGGHGSMFDVNRDAQVHAVLQKAASAGKIVAAECHGTGALAFANLIRGKRVTGFPDVWEPAALRPELPYVLQDVLNRTSGGRYESGLKPDAAPQPFVIVDGRIITSRDPMSSAAMGQALVEALRR